MREANVEPQESPATWFAELCAGGRLWPKGRAGGRRVVPRQTSRKDTSRPTGYRIAAELPNFYASQFAQIASSRLRRRCGARMLAQLGRARVRIPSRASVCSLRAAIVMPFRCMMNRGGLRRKVPQALPAPDASALRCHFLLGWYLVRPGAARRSIAYRSVSPTARKSNQQFFQQIELWSRCA